MINEGFGGATDNGGDAPLDGDIHRVGSDSVPFWEVSSFCAGNGSCVEVARLPTGGFAVRDSRRGADGAVLTFTRREWDDFVSGIKAGELQ